MNIERTRRPRFGDSQRIRETPEIPEIVVKMAPILDNSSGITVPERALGLDGGGSGKYSTWNNLLASVEG